MKKSNIGYIALFFAAFFWGSTFVAQSIGMDYIGPFTFTAIRSLVGATFLFPVTIIVRKERDKRGISLVDETGKTISRKQYNRNTIIGGVACGIVLSAAANVQQVAMINSPAGKAGFITSMYVVLVPIFGLFSRKRVNFITWIAVFLSVIGLYLLCNNQNDYSVGRAEVLLIMCAALFAVHILTIDKFAVKVDPVAMSCLQFLVAGIVSCVLMLLFEHPDITQCLNAWGPILYAGVMSSGVAYTLQMVGQKNTDNPTTASLIMCLESVISVLSGWIIQHDILSIREILGCVLMFGAVVLASLKGENG